MDLVVEGTTLTSRGPEPIRLGIQEGLFVDPRDEPADLTYDEGYLFPAAIDLHVHFREPGFPQKEDLTSGTKSAAYGGVGLALDMPNTDPATMTVEAYEAKAALVQRKAIIDVGLWAGLDPDLQAVELGDRATGYKLYAGPTTGDLLLADEEAWKQAVHAIAGTKRPMAVHAEHPARLADARQDEQAPWEPASHLRSRPGEAEVEALSLIAAEGHACGARVHAAHVSDPQSVDICRRHGITSEVTPHHLLLNSDDVEELGAYGKVNPPIRDEVDRQGLWEALVAGDLRCIASDHAPHTREEKEAGFDKAPSGLPGVETLYPMMLALAMDGQLPIERAIDACCTQPAKVIDVPAGSFDDGRWASWIHVPDQPREIHAEDLHSRCGWTPFEGHQGLFPDAMMVRGRWVLRDGELFSRPGDGRFVGGPGWDQEA